MATFDLKNSVSKVKGQTSRSTKKNKFVELVVAVTRLMAAVF